MGLGEIPLKAIDRKKVGRPLRSPAFHEDASINAFDTETITRDIAASDETNAKEPGKIYLLSRVYGDLPEKEYDSTIGNSDFSPLTAEQLFNALVTNQTRRPAVNVWYNLDFDVNALIGTVLNERHMTELADTNTTTFEVDGMEYEMTYIKKKFLSIKDEHRHVSTHYDISQFFYTSLKKAAESWLDIDKKDIDPSKAHEYDWNTIIKYAERDAKVTYELWNKYIKLAEGELGIPFGKPISTGFVAMHVAFDTLYQKPKWGSSHFQEMARKAYHGGRFEVYRRGFFEDVIGLDINSAYPYHMAQMPDLGSCNLQVTGGTLNEIRNADWGFVTATVSTDPSRRIQPFAVKDRRVCFPVLDDHKLTVTIDEFLFALDNDYLLDYDIHKTALAYEVDSVSRPFSFLKDWYERRKKYKNKYEKTGNPRHDRFQFILKVIMNSVYGKTCQVTEKHEYLPTDENYTTSKTEFITEGYDGDMIKGHYEGGDLLNPFYASYITAKTRLQLHKKALELGLEEDTIMFATDCLMINAKDISERDIHAMIDPAKLGGWDFEYSGSAFVVGSGVYDVMKDDKVIKMAKRGFKEVTKTYRSWREAAAESNGKIILENERPARFKEYLLHAGNPRSRNRPAEFFKDERMLSPDFDSKRNWKETATFDSLLKANHGSKPIMLDREEP